MAGSFGEFSVYQVEVCRTCSWNHLVASFVMGEKGEAAAPGDAARSSRSRPSRQPADTLAQGEQKQRHATVGALCPGQQASRSGR